MSSLCENKMPCYRKDDRAMRPIAYMGALKIFESPCIATVLDCGTSIPPLLPARGCLELLTGSDTIYTSGCKDLSGTRADGLS